MDNTIKDVLGDEFFRVVERIHSHESCILRVYSDSKGVPTIGWGHNLQMPISRKAADQIFADDLEIAAGDADRLISRHGVTLNQARMGVLIEMAFNLGYLRLSGFVKMWAALSDGDYDSAADEMLDSDWAGDVGQRAVTLAEIMRAGDSVGLA